MRMLVSDRRQWHEWFAWHPVAAAGVLVWLERVQRRWDANANCSCIHPDDRGYPDGAWEYRLSAVPTPTGARDE